MGMAATQARLISLKARMSNVEYQGQQINQERTILSQQATDLYTSLLAMSVPTPPSTQDYAKITYSGMDGNTVVTIGNVKPSGQKYIVEIQQTQTGDAIGSDYGSVAVKKIGEGEGEINQIRTRQIDLSAGREITGVNAVELQNYYISVTEGGNTTYYRLDINSEYVSPENSGSDSDSKATTYKITIPPNDGGKTFGLYQTSSSGDKYIDTKDIHQTAQTEYYVDGKQAYTWDEAKAIFGSDAVSAGGLFDWDRYEKAIRNTYGTAEGSISTKDFYVYVDRTETGAYYLKLALKSDVESPDGFAQTYSYTGNGKYTTSEEVDQCELEFDTRGRIKRIGIPSYDQVTHEIISYRFIDLSAETSYDEKAYQDAYAQYEYKMYEYDKKNQEINAKTQILQEEDKNLELKLTRLDNERDALKNEMDACDKVLKDNIEKSFKTFSG